MDIFDWEKVDIANAMLKVAIWIAALVIVWMAMKEKFASAGQDIVNNASAIESVGEIMEQMAGMEENFSKEDVVLSTISFLVSEKGGQISVSKIRKSLTAEELAVVEEIEECVEFDGRTTEAVATELSSKKEIVEYYGLSNAEKLNGIVKSHEEWYK